MIKFLYVVVGVIVGLFLIGTILDLFWLALNLVMAVIFGALGYFVYYFIKFIKDEHKNDDINNPI